jgi:hypothetical protein
MSRFPDSELSQAERSAAVAWRRYYSAIATPTGRRAPLVRLPDPTALADVPDDDADLEAQLLDQIDEGMKRLEISCLVNAIAALAETAADWDNLCRYANDLAFDEPVTNRKWAQRWRAKNRARLAELREAWLKLMSA